MFKYSATLTVLLALIISCIKPLDDFFQSSTTDIDIVSEDGIIKDTIACYVNENIVIGISVLFTDSLDSISFKVTDSIYGGFSNNEIENLIKINLRFNRPGNVVIIATGYKNGTTVTSDSAVLIITLKEGLNMLPVVHLKPVRNYASPALPCTVKVSVTNPNPGQDMEMTLIPRGDFIGESLFVWTPKDSDIGSLVSIILIAKNNQIPPQATFHSVIITVIADNEVLSKPENLRVAQRADNFIKITWRGDSLADSYILYRNNSKKDSIWEEIPLSDTSYIDSSATVYFYRVAAVNFFGVSKPSETIQGTDTIHYARRVFFTDTRSTAYESDSLHRITLGMNTPSASDITVWYTVKSVINHNFTTLIRAGDTTGVCSLIIVNDTAYQGKRIISIKLDSVSSGFIYGNGTHTVLFVDDDTTFTVVYNGNGATGGRVPEDRNRYAWGDTVKVLMNNGNLVKSGFSFSGWCHSRDSSTTIYTPGTKFIMGYQGVTLYAKWKITTYTITYDGNGNTGGKVPSPQTKRYGVALTLASNTGNLVRKGFTFIGWNTASNGNGKDYTEGVKYTANAGLTLYAKWGTLWIDKGTTLIDPDGNVYTTVTIGTQVWTVENLKTTRYSDGEAIPLVTDTPGWKNMKTPGYCWYENDKTVGKSKYGALYNWYAVATGRLAPSGWRVPTDEDWNTLQNYLTTNGYNYDGTTWGNKIAKAMATKTDWSSTTKTGTIGSVLTKNNASGFSALPGGYRNSDGNFFYRGNYGLWWSATMPHAWLPHACYRSLYYAYEGLYSDNHSNKYGISVRLVRD